MELPNVESAIISPEKIEDYLLCLNHREGGGKAQWFMRNGEFTPRLVTADPLEN